MLTTIEKIFERVSAFRDDGSSDRGFRLACRVLPPAEQKQVLRSYSDQLPSEVLDLWHVCGEAWLFEDIEYGQWGLHLLSAAQGLERLRREASYRPDSFMPGDILIGEFLGDTELLIYAPAEKGERRLLVALPLDSRHDWYPVGRTITEFLDRYVDMRGEKFWIDEPLDTGDLQR